MNPGPESYWVQKNLDAKLVEVITKRLDSAERVSFTVRDIQQESEASVTDIRALLDEMARAQYLRVVESRICPICRVQLSDDDLARERCPCGVSFDEEAVPQVVRTYVRDGRILRDIRWAVAVHGMNTPGAWQQDVSWRLAKMYGYSIPVGIYKYGNIKLSPLVPHRQKVHRDRLIQYLRKVRGEMKGTKFGERPDVIAHSFGTWLISEALEADTGPDRVRLGRIILTGSIVRPDFDWKRLLDEGRIEGVLCHCALRDVPVRMAQYFIPGAGPSGTRGFNDRKNVAHIVAPSFGHSDYFSEVNLPTVMREVWAPFLRREAATFGVRPSAELSESVWRPNVLRIVTRSMKAALLFALGIFAVVAVVVAITGMAELLGRFF